MSPFNKSLKTTKPQFLKLISAIRHYRLNEPGKTGIIFIPQGDVDKNILNKYIHKLFDGNILNEFNKRNLKELESYDYETDENDLEKDYIEVTDENKKDYYAFSCSSIEKIDEYIKSLYILGSSNLIIEHYGDSGFRNDREKKGASCSFTEKESKILYFLYSNQGKSQKTEDIMRECKCSRNDIKSACNNIRMKLKNKLKYSDSESKAILPTYQHGCYVLNAYLDSP